ncbi:MAG: hypothetical protein A3E37_02010 [Candidatus Andersenbacteria bacterium RIFCSPHIGHO2_12_FULL_46_9]|nr:MAG: hypothetical protein UW94_C0015G0024 [Parcubacteria group bacterium GW2011_GWA2_45_14]OGY33906.1 MAG: hypothetical protein A3B76_01515 [Candidatus Andersenbacteria bacterium RIFCSPHIGHO2_02_FULL_46_16]OGY36036.1 MAG: hypothetical protein A3I08_02910 [Candidatus Andersenbacteria bacterium RIFCSPLOWO2_02_FULL_46_11]OGY36808.1 MAG: hypothetical protein A3E37_02010 [Candidatus Andersenbacteria bacterium RIFCSPHIGHO2_12_FULL_46_9]HBE89986.1 hypothetical protein [Candidatus Andersenbacteria b
MPNQFENIESNEPQAFRLDKDNFEKHFPQGTIQEIDESVLSKDTNHYLYVEIKKYADEGKLASLYLIKHESGDEIFVALTSGRHPSEKGMHYYEEIELYEKRGDKTLGNGKVVRAYVEKPSQPFVGWTSTEEKFTNQGLATRRLQTMNALALATWQQPLRSGNFEPGDYTEKAWERLVKQHEVERIDTKGRQYYQFILES